MNILGKNSHLYGLTRGCLLAWLWILGPAPGRGVWMWRIVFLVCGGSRGVWGWLWVSCGVAYDEGGLISIFLLVLTKLSFWRGPVRGVIILCSLDSFLLFPNFLGS